jgi:predicted  nucleic acid-binding Zn-ribbon protein
MRVRHKTPTLVSMWMLDVFCCALGCVTLLWLLNTRQAGTALTDLNEVRAQLLSTSSELDHARVDLKLALTNLDATKLRLNSEVSQLTTQLGAVRTEKDELARKLGIAQAEAKAAQALLDSTKLALNSAEAKIEISAKDLAALRTKAEAADDLLKKKQKDVDALTKKATDVATAADELAKLIRKKDEEIAVLTKRSADAQKLLDDSAAKLASTKKELDAANAKTAEAMASAKSAATEKDKDLAAAAGTIKDLTKKINDANATIIDLQGEKAKLADKVDKVMRDAENRFAGIAMTGKSAVFVVDISGSMDKLDVNTPAPQKWPVVCETVAKVMRSIPTLERYQIIVFSSNARWLMSEDATWQKFEGEKSVTAVKNALLRTKPEGDTNMHAAFELVFALRSRGLDTVYLFSDGLPTSGPGLTQAQENANPPLKENERGEILGKYIREKMTRDWNRPLSGADRVKVHAVGFFFESPDVGAFLWALARENDGSFVGMSRP